MHPQEMAATRAPPSRVSTLLLLVMALTLLSSPIVAQDCSAGLSDVTVCTPFVVPGPGGDVQSPSAECCNALKGVNHDCLCSTLSIISKLPSTCKLPPLSCGA